MRQTPADVPALERGIRILSLLRHEPLSAAQLQSRLRIHRASVYRLLSTLQRARFVSQDPATGVYGLGPELMTLGFYARTHTPLIAAAKPLLQRVAAATHVMSEICVYAGGWRLLILDTWQSEETPVRITARAGMLLELHHVNGQGLCHLAYASERRVQMYIDLSKSAAGRRELVLTRPADASLFEQCRQWRRLGYAWRNRTQHLENGRVAAPIFDSKRELIASIGIICDTKRLTPLKAAEWGGVLKDASREIEARLAESR